MTNDRLQKREQRSDFLGNTAHVFNAVGQQWSAELWAFPAGHAVALAGRGNDEVANLVAIEAACGVEL
jgi:hypothetical protein